MTDSGAGFCAVFTFSAVFPDCAGYKYSFCCLSFRCCGAGAPCLPLTREVARRAGGRENERIQQGKYPFGKNLKEKYDTMGTKTVV